MTTTKKNVRPHIQVVIDECLPKLKALGIGRCAVTIGGSHNWSGRVVVAIQNIQYQSVMITFYQCLNKAIIIYDAKNIK